jgi:Flp pilus assembly protein TadG
VMLRMMRARPMKRQRGADIVEFIITLPIMMIVFFVILGLGVVVCDWAIVASASRAATREAIRTPSSPSPSSNAPVWDAADAVLRSLITWTGTSPYICDRLNTATSNCLISPYTRTPTTVSGTVTTPQSPAAGADVTVTVRYPVTFTIPWVYTFTLPLQSVTHMPNLPQ